MGIISGRRYWIPGQRTLDLSCPWGRHHARDPAVKPHGRPGHSHVAYQREGGGVMSHDTQDEFLRVERLSVTYPGSARPAVSDIEFSVRRASTLGIVGESGS